MGPETGEADTGRDGTDGTGLLPQPEPSLIAKGGRTRSQPGNEADTGGGLVDSTDPLPHSDDPGSVLVSESAHDDRGGGEATIEGREVGERDSHLHPGVEGVVESGLSQEGNDVDVKKAGQINSPPSDHTPFQPLSLAAAPSDDIDSPPVPDRVQEVLGVSEREPGAEEEDESDWKSAASATAELFLRTVKETSNGYPPLKSIAECLYFILKNCEVWPPSRTFDTQSHNRSSKQK